MEDALPKTMSLERATEFAEAWNTHDPDFVASFFATGGALYTSIGSGSYGDSYFGREEIRRGAKAFFDRFPDGRFEDIKVIVSGNIGTLEWNFTMSGADGKRYATAGCDLLEFEEELVLRKSAFRKVQG